MDQLFRTSVTYRDPADKQKKKISMNIFDAFKGVPDQKPRSARKCNCCGKAHFKATAPAASRKGEKQEGGEGGGKGLNFTKKENQKLKQMVADHKSWDAVHAEIQKGSIADLKAHYEQIKPSEEQLKKDEEKKAKAEMHKAEGLKKKAEKDTEKEGKEDEEKDEAKDDAKDKRRSPKKTAKTTALKKDDEDPDQLTEKNLKAWSAKYDQSKWDMAASKYFDMTGQHMPPEQLKEMMAK